MANSLEHDLDELLQKATDPSSEISDELAFNLFCSIVRQDTSLVRKSTEMLVTKIKSTNVIQSRKALELLEECMSKCGPEFQMTVARFQFLNELIRLVSKKFSGEETPAEIRNKILDCLSLWTIQYPERTKIKEAYETLRRSGVQHEEAPTVSATCKRTTFMDDENDKIFKKLIQSTNREDLQRANLLIQYLVKQDAKKCELGARQRMELQEARNSAALLDQIVDCWIEDNHVENQELAKEVYTICKKSITIVRRMPEIIEDDESLLGDAIEVNDILLTVLEKYENSLSTGRTEQLSTKSAVVTNLMSGLDQIKTEVKQIQNPLDDLSDIFSQSVNTEASTSDTSFNLLEPISMQSISNPKSEQADASSAIGSSNNRVQVGRNLPDIDKLSEDLFKENLITNERIGTFKKVPNKIPIKDLKTERKNETKTESSIQDVQTKIDGLTDIFNKSTSLKDLSMVSLDNLLKDSETKAIQFDISVLEDPLIGLATTNGVAGHNAKDKADILFSDFDDLVVTIPVENGEKCANQCNELLADDEEIVAINDEPRASKIISDDSSSKKPVKHLSEINIELNSIQPSIVPPRIVMEDIQGLRVTLNFALDRPCSNVSVIVISTINQSSSAISDYQFDASVPKPCKLRLISPTGNSLPGVKPFRPPTDAIQQILLLSNPIQKSVDITCIIGYRLGDDPDPIKESVVVKDIPYFE